jgi:hypothetical protein
MSNEKQTDFNMSFAELEKTANNIIASVTRDAKEFADFDITAKDIQMLLDVFVTVPTDEELKKEQVEATQGKKNVEDTIRQTITTIELHVINKFSNKSSQWRRLGIHNLSKTTDYELKRLAERVIRVSPTLMPEFAKTGKWEFEILSLQTEVNDFVIADKAQHDAIVNRGLKTEDRNDAANALYHRIVNVCEIGKKIWKDMSETKYNDYVIYDTPAPAAPTTHETTPITN